MAAVLSLELGVKLRWPGFDRRRTIEWSVAYRYAQNNLIPSVRTRLTGHEFLEKGRALLKRFEEVLSPDQPPLANWAQHRIASHMQTVVTHVGTPLQQLEHALHPWMTVVVMPVFALANVGVTLDADVLAILVSPVALACVLACSYENLQIFCSRLG